MVMMKGEEKGWSDRGWGDTHVKLMKLSPLSGLKFGVAQVGSLVIFHDE